MSETNEYLQDFKLLDDAGFDANHRFVAETSIAALYFFKDLCKKKNVPIENITTRDIIDEIIPLNQKANELKAVLTSMKAKRVSD
jgi:hypothetical protein